jgi:hypothetical protein
VIDVLQKKVQRGNALRESALDLVPFVARNDSRQKIIGENPFSSLLVAVDRERDPLVQEGEVGCLLPLFEFTWRQFQQRPEQGRIMRARDSGGKGEGSRAGLMRSTRDLARPCCTRLSLEATHLARPIEIVY